MILDEHTPCPACPDDVRALYAIARRALVRMHHERDLPPEYEELLAILDALRPWIDAHHANQLHSHSIDLEDARHPTVQRAPAAVTDVDHDGSER